MRLGSPMTGQPQAARLLMPVVSASCEPALCSRGGEDPLISPELSCNWDCPLVRQAPALEMSLLYMDTAPANSLVGMALPAWNLSLTDLALTPRTS